MIIQVKLIIKNIGFKKLRRKLRNIKDFIEIELFN
jgi:hypothetical protein